MNRYRILKDGSYKFHTFTSNQVFNKKVWLENKDNFEKNAEGNYYEFYNTDGTPDVAKNTAKAEADAKEANKNNGEVYVLNGVDYLVPFTSIDAVGMMQVKTAFEMGEIATNIKFTNGTTLPILVTEFLPFALWFVQKRNSFYKD